MSELGNGMILWEVASWVINLTPSYQEDTTTNTTGCTFPTPAQCWFNLETLNQHWAGVGSVILSIPFRSRSRCWIIRWIGCQEMHGSRRYLKFSLLDQRGRDSNIQIIFPRLTPRALSDWFEVTIRSVSFFVIISCPCLLLVILW